MKVRSRVLVGLLKRERDAACLLFSRLSTVLATMYCSRTDAQCWVQVKVEEALKPKVVDPKDIVIKVTGTSE